MSIVGSSKKPLHNDQPIYRGNYRDVSVVFCSKKRKKKRRRRRWKRRRRRRRSLPLRPKRRTPLRFDQIQEGPQDPFCANAQGNVEEDHGTMKKRRIHMGSCGRQREDESGPGLTIGMFSGSDTEGARGEKKRRNPARARIYRVTLSELFQYRPKAELVLSSSFPSRSFIKSSRATAAAFVFFLASTQDFFFLFQTSSHYSGKYDAI